MTATAAWTLDDASFLAVAMLQVAVPMRLAELDGMTGWWRQHTISEWAIDARYVIPANADVMMFRPLKPAEKGVPALAFNVLSAGLAALSTAPGGVRYCGLVWCSRHAPGGMRGDGPCQRCVDDEAQGRPLTGESSVPPPARVQTLHPALIESRTGRQLRLRGVEQIDVIIHRKHGRLGQLMEATVGIVSRDEIRDSADKSSQKLQREARRG